MTTGRVAKNTLILTALKLLLPASSLAMVLVVARYLGTEGLGRYSLVFSFFYVFSTLSLLGINAVISRDGAARPDDLPVLLGNAITVGTVASVVMMGVMALVQGWFGYDQATQVALLILALAMLPSTLLSYFESAFIACERMEFIAIFSLGENLVKVVLSVLLLLIGYGLNAVMVVAVATRVLACVASMGFVRRLGLSLRWRADRSVLSELLVVAPTFTLIAVLALICSKVDVFMLSKLGGMHDVGVYGAGGRILDIASVLPASLCLSMFPGLARATSSDPKSLPVLGQKTLRYLMAMTLPLTVGATVLAEPIVSFLYGAKFQSAGPLLMVMVWSVIPYAWVRYYANVMVAANRQHVDLFLNIIMLGVTIVLNLLLIPSYGPMGAALAGVIAMVLLALGQYLYMLRYLNGHLAALPQLGKPFCAALVMGAVVWWLKDLPVLVTVGVGAVVYGMALWLVRFFDAAEKRLICDKMSLAQMGLRKWGSAS